MATIPGSGNEDESLPEQDEVRRAKQRFQAMFDLADVGMAHMALDGRFLQVNQKLCDIVGYTSAEMLGHTFQDITAPADLKATLVQMEQLLAGEFTTSTMEKRYLRADGSTIWNNLTVSLVRDQQGNPDYFISVIEDISERKAIEEAFQREQQAFLRIAENAEDIITRFDRSLQHLYVNPAITVATGQAPEMFIGKTNEDLGMSAEQVMLWNAKLNGVLDTGEPDSLEFSFPSPTGLRYYHSRLTAERDSQGEIVSVLSIARDVTDLKQAQFALIQSEARARRLIDSNFIGVGIADVNGIFEANDALLEMVGYTRADLAAGGIDWLAMTPPEFISRDEFGLQELRERGICTPYQKEYLHRDGSRVAILVGAATIQADPLQWVCFILDITERHRPELSLQQSLNALLMVAEALVTSEEPSDDSELVKESPEDVARRVLTPIVEVLSCEGVLMVKLRPASDIIDTLVMVGIEEFDEPALLEQMRGQSLSSRFESPAYFKQLEAGEVVKQAVDIWSYPGRQPTARLGRSVLIPIRLGEDLLGLLTLYPKAGRAGYTKEERLLAAAMAKLAALLIERERLQHDREEAWVRMQAAQEVMQQMDEFLGIASHELKTPLTSLQGNLQLARRQLSRLNIPQSFGKQATMSLPALLDRAERQIKVQSRLINDLLDVSHIHANRLELSPALVDLSQIVQAAVENQHNLVLTRSLKVEVPSQEVQVFADAERIGQVVNNYLSNALKYSEPDCPVKVYVMQAGNMARVEVIDEGPGLLFDQQAQIWQRFYRVPGIEVKSGSGVGLGLGLHICKTIIERQAGEVGVESAPGQGSTFWFTLPLAEPVQDVVE